MRGVYVLPAALVLAFSSSAWAGRIAGRVTDAVTGAPLANISVYVREVQSVGTTDALGNYITDTDLPTGTYTVWTRNSSGFINKIYDDVPCVFDGCMIFPNPRARGIAVTAGITTGNINFALEKGGRIAGRVISASTGAPLSNVYVEVYVPEHTVTGIPVTSTVTDASGNYITNAGLLPGSYFVGCPERNGIVAGYEIPANVAAGVTTTGVNFALGAGGGVSGTVTQGASGLPVAVILDFFSRNGAFAFRYRQTSSFTASYELNQVPPGTYVVTARAMAHPPMIPAFADPHYLVDQLYNGVSCPGGLCNKNTGTPVTVTAGAMTSGVNFHFPFGGRVAGRVTDAGSSSALPDAHVDLYNSAGVAVTSAATDDGGGYLSPALPVGAYFATAGASGHVDQLYDNIPCPGGSCTKTSATPIAVTAGQTSRSVDFALDAGLGPPRNLRATVTPQAVTLEWDPPLDVTGLSGYVVEAGLAPGAVAVTVSVPGQSLTVPAPPSGVYFLRVRSVIGNALGPASNEVAIAVPAPCMTAPGSVSALTASVTATNVVLSWSAPIAGDRPSHYVISIGTVPGGSNLGTMTVDASTTSISSSAPVGTYYVRVTAANACGTGPQSNDLSITVSDPRPPERDR